jgi:hypothetical protein
MEFRYSKSLEEKKDNDEAPNETLSGDTKFKQGKTINMEQMPVKTDNHLPETFIGDINGIQF